ncbi:SEL1-like repeat protein [Akkermansia sp.]|uniref:tetratricopeptide repeat protein n=1 Tax=Akkermansia sp. TaxID=1872421 RepID=UPI0031B88839
MEIPSKKIIGRRPNGSSRQPRQGDADAQYSLGLIYDQGGHGIEPDRKEALTWYLKAAEQGHEEARQKLNKADSRATAK